MAGERMLAVAVMALLTSGTAAAEQVHSDAIAKPRRQHLVHLLRHDCGACHGLKLNGGLGPALTPSALKGRPDVELEQIILQGRPDRGMPPWDPYLKEQEVQWLVDGLKAGAFTNDTDG